jgi:hypothetical protein
MIRLLYQVTLFALQIAMLLHVAQPLAQVLGNDAAFGAFPDGPLAALQIASSVTAVLGSALALAYPGIALFRHRQRGGSRFDGVPRWPVALALAGTAIFLLATILDGVAPVIASADPLTAALTARPLRNAGLALMAAGVLCAEILRRSVGVPRVIVVPRDPSPPRIEVMHPPELATRVG